MEPENGTRKRIRRDPDTTRRLILDTTEKLMVEEGYAAVSSRRIAQEIGLNAATVHYYYPSTDDVFIALHRRMTERQLGEIEKVLAADEPLQAFWSFQSSAGKTALGVEFLGLANHRKAIRDTLAASTERARDDQSKMLAEAVGGSASMRRSLSSEALVTILVGLGRLLANEERVGITRGHEEVRSFVKWALQRLSAEGGPAQVGGQTP